MQREATSTHGLVTTVPLAAVVLFGAAVVAGERQTAVAAQEDGAVSTAEQKTREGLVAGISGDTESRNVALKEALRLAPDYALARWHTGQIRRNDSWLAVEEAERFMADDPKLNEYRRLRDLAHGDGRRELALARWCRAHELGDAETLHLKRVLAIDGPERKKAMERLGLQFYGGMMLTQDEIGQLEAQAAKAEKDLAKWSPIVAKWRKAIEGGPGRKQRYALEHLRALRDPSAIGALETQLSSCGEKLALEVVAVLGNMPEHEATESLVSHALDLPWESVSDAAIDELKQRPLHDYAPLLLRHLVAVIQSRFHVGVGPDGMVRHEHQFFREGAQENFLLNNSYVGGPRFYITGRKSIGVPVNRLDVGNRRAIRQKGLESLAKTQEEQREALHEANLVRNLTLVQETARAIKMEQDVAIANAAISQKNSRTFEVLERTSGQALPRSPVAWWEWWQDYNETYREEKPMYTHQFGRFDPYYVPWTQVTVTQMSCFPAGTQVRTQTGVMAIEEIEPGDRVLSQDVETGELAYKLVVKTTVRPPSKLLEVRIGETSITTTKGHPFWVNNVGWRMAKRLEGGQQLHSIRGGQVVGSIKPAGEAEAYNLVVEDFATYFVGDPGVLVHDNTYRTPTTAITPGLSRTQF